MCWQREMYCCDTALSELRTRKVARYLSVGCRPVVLPGALGLLQFRPASAFQELKNYTIDPHRTVTIRESGRSGSYSITLSALITSDSCMMGLSA